MKRHGGENEMFQQISEKMSEQKRIERMKWSGENARLQIQQLFITT
jgi:hypothetical protein